MTITNSDYEDMSIRLQRTVRTSESEEYDIFSDDPDAGFELPDELPHESRVGVLILQYANEPLSQQYVNGTLIVESDWAEIATSHLIEDLDMRIIRSIGDGNKDRRESFNVTVYTGEQVGEAYDFETDDVDRGLHGLHNQMQRTQALVDDIPEEIVENIDQIVKEQYEDIEDIIESQNLTEEEEKRLRDKLRVGLERGLPTLVYEGES